MYSNGMYGILNNLLISSKYITYGDCFSPDTIINFIATVASIKTVCLTKLIITLFIFDYNFFWYGWNSLPPNCRVGQKSVSRDDAILNRLGLSSCSLYFGPLV
uniref:SFRICE_029116 n=1 Tax=Spodoptera frugiperda TaxID=7108 RepID=A0A2H1VWC0_SPOFR